MSSTTTTTKAKRVIAMVFDTETTGLPKDGRYNASPKETDVWPRMVQLGMALLYDDGSTDNWCELIAPPDGVAFPIPAAATNTHGITDEMCRERGIALIRVLEAFSAWSAKAPVLVAHNMEFDRPVVIAEMIRSKALPAVKLDDFGNPIKQATICTKLSTMAFVGIPLGWYIPGQPHKWPSLQELHTKLFGTGFEDAHDAMIDVLATCRCFHRLIQLGTFPNSTTFLPTQA